jgi:hypothetical protein
MTSFVDVEPGEYLPSITTFLNHRLFRNIFDIPVKPVWGILLSNSCRVEIF